MAVESIEFYHYLELHHSQTSNFNLNLRIY